jgi:calcium-dependent protein kinase
MPSLGWSGGFHSAFQLGEVVGSGSFGTVHRAVHRHTGAAYAVKVLPKVCGLRGTQLDAIRREVHTWRAAQGSPFVVRLEGVYEDEGHAYLVQELCAGGSLKERLAASDSGVVSEAEAAAIMRGVLDLLAECHKQAIVYGDLKPANIMFSTAASGDATQQQQQQAATAAVGGVRAIDFGCSHMGVRGRATRFTTACGSPLFMAPEVALEWYGVGADMWSAGMMLYQMLTGRLPFWPSKTLEQVAALPGYQLLAAIRTHEVQFPRALWRGISVQARELVSRMLERDPAARITAAQALQHPWLASALGAPSSSSSSSSSSSAGSDAGSDSSSSSSRANNVVPLSRSSSSGAQLSPRQGAAGAPGPLSPQRPSPLRSMLSGELAPPTDMHRAPSMQRVPSMSVLAPAPE